MQSLPADWLSLLLLTFVLGLKHGFDADHLATIDGLTRYNLRTRPRTARLCGTLFSLGHGAVVMLIALSASVIAGQFRIPEWFDLLGALISIAFLAALGTLNLLAVLRAAPDEVVQPVGLKGRLLGSLRHISNPFLIALVGALFALSFDTLSQAAFFALTATRFGGWQHALLLALLFVLGMLVTDGVNGLWIARLIARADHVARVASRVMGLVVSSLSLLVSAFGIMKLASPAIGTWSEGKELYFGASLVLLIAASFMLAIRLARAPRIPA
ncbi:DNA repair protein [Uliginosibacterium flavum]|uniref:Nickel/cobalt efflux system n=1 Tax=Uliginosibacterium flavum TaxID=1396831 RepID=A0ABV2TK97_9RHOO